MRWVALLLVAACHGSHGAAGDGAGSGSDGATGDGAPASSWLEVRGNRIVHADGTSFHGRGVDLHDERSCSACSFMPPDPAGVDRWADEIIDHWHATLIRFLLSSKAAPFDQSELQWKSLVDDPQYLADIVTNVTHMTSKPGVYVEVTVFADPTIKDNTADLDSEWPSSLGDTHPVYVALAEAFHANPQVMFGLTNEPHTSADHDPALATVYGDAIAAIRAVEDAHGTPHHIVVVQAPEGYARDLTYFVAHPLAGDQIAYEIHPYNVAPDFDALIVQPSMHLPVIIGEYGPAAPMTESDITALWTTAQPTRSHTSAGRSTSAARRTCCKTPRATAAGSTRRPATRSRAPRGATCCSRTCRRRGERSSGSLYSTRGDEMAGDGGPRGVLSAGVRAGLRGELRFRRRWFVPVEPAVHGEQRLR